MALDLKTYEVETKPDWCPGCGDFGVLNGLKGALGELELKPHNVAVVSGIGCSSNLPGFIKAYGYHSLHGRSLPVAQGVKLANIDLTVIATGGDGDGYGIGVGHFVHACRRNIDMTYVVMDNQIYGLTTGQTSPTSMKGFVTKTAPAPDGNIELPINPISLALAAGATFVARAFSGDPKHMVEMIALGIKHKGFSLIDVFSPCVTYNKVNTYQYFRPKVYNIQKEGHDPKDFSKAMEKAGEWGDRIPIGLFYEAPPAPSYEELDSVISKLGSMIKQPLQPKKEVMDQLLGAFV